MSDMAWRLGSSVDISGLESDVLSCSRRCSCVLIRFPVFSSFCSEVILHLKKVNAFKSLGKNDSCFGEDAGESR